MKNMKKQDLRIGNLVQWDDESSDIVEIVGIYPNEDFNNEYWCTYKENRLKYGAQLSEFVPIKLTEEWLLKLPKGLIFPEWIKSVHELQNWYYWNNDKKELTIN